MTSFTPHQDAALSAVGAWLKAKPGTSGNPNIFRLFGYAGTGKTTLARHIAEDVDGDVKFAAFTGKAALVMRSKGCHDAQTIHSLIYRARESGEEVPSFDLWDDAPVSKAALIIIDECSMVDAELGRDLMSFGVPVLVLGDPAQLPPISGGGFYALPNRFHVPGAVLCGEAAGFVNMAALKGVHYAMQSGILAAEAIYDSLKSETADTVTGLWGYSEKIQNSFIWKDLWKVRNVRPAFQRSFFYGGFVTALSSATGGRLPKYVSHSSDAQAPVFAGTRYTSYPKPDGTYTFDKLSSVFLSGNKTRDDQPNHIRIQTHVPRELGLTWEWMCPARVYEVGDQTGDMVDVKINPSNCVQCGAITAKGGQLTPPEGGSGPEYSLT